MTIKITEQNGRVLIRRWAYNPEKKRSMPTTIASMKGSVYAMPEQLPAEKIEEFGVTKEEQEQYIEYYKSKREESEKRLNKYKLERLGDDMKDVVEALEDSDAVDQLELEYIEKCSDAVNDLKKKLTAIKAKKVKAAKRKSEKKEEKTNRKPKLEVNVTL
jgi:hypothetical protein